MQYDLTSTHRIMLRDSARTDAFCNALRAAVRPGDVVLDVGAGSGVLSLVAARLGAGRVYAVERTAMAEVARDLTRVNGLEHVVQVIEAPIEAVSLTERVDLIVSEWLGSIGVDENLLPMVLFARDRWLKPGGRLVPCRVSAWMAPVRLAMRPDVAFFRDRPYGLDLTPLAEPSVHELLCYRRRIVPGNMIAPPAMLWQHDVTTLPAEQAALPARARLDFVAPEHAAVNGLAAWFSCDLAGGVSFTNAPDAPDTHWGQLLLPLEHEQPVRAGDVLTVELACIPWEPERSHLAWSVRIGNGAWEHHDTRVFEPWPAAPRDSTPYRSRQLPSYTGGTTPWGLGSDDFSHASRSSRIS